MQSVSKLHGRLIIDLVDVLDLAALFVVGSSGLRELVDERLVR